MTEEPQKETIEKVRRLVAGKMALPIAKVQPASCLFRDLGVDGDDAYEILETYAEQLHVSMEGFNFLDYFGCEGVNPLTPIAERALRLISPDFRHRWEEAIAREREITIEHLALCAEAGLWSSSPIERERPLRPVRHAIITMLWACFFLPGLLFLILLVVVGIYGAIFDCGMARLKLVSGAAIGLGTLYCLARSTAVELREKYDFPARSHP